MSHQGNLIKYFQCHSKAIIYLMALVAHRPYGKNVHDLRVAIRRIRAALWCFQHSSAHIHFSDLEQRLHKIEKALGHVRELDVAVIDANKYGIDSSKLLKRRHGFELKLSKILSFEVRKKITRELSSAVGMIQNMHPVFSNEVHNILRIRIKKNLKQKIHGSSKLHRLRIEIKKTRYIFEVLKKPIRPLKQLQTVLGEAHDLEVLQKLVGKNIKVKRDQNLLNKKGVRLIRPTLSYAMKELGLHPNDI